MIQISEITRTWRPLSF